MARMIPALLDPHCSSPGEKEVFDRFSEASDSQDWIVLHSLDIAKHKTQITGEVDFVVIVPQLGVLCLEIKACLHVERGLDGVWYFGRRATIVDPRGPFKQASLACQSVRAALTQARPDLNRIVMWSAVLFPYLEFRLQSPEWHTWQCIDRRDFNSKTIVTLCAEVLLRARTFLRSVKSAGWFDPSSREPSLDQCEAILQALRPRFEFYESGRARRTRQSRELKTYTELQYEALDVIEANKRVVCSGPAGSGKTLLALECARRAYLREHRTLFLCFNRHLGRELAAQTRELEGHVTTRTLHRHLLDIVGREGPPKDAGPMFWEHHLPEEALDVLLSSDARRWTFDHLILDEAQDVCKDLYLDFLDLSLTGGLGRGQWLFFGDFGHQAIFGGREGVRRLSERTEFFRFPLFDNCRNTPRVGSYARLLGGLEPDYRRYLRPDNHEEPVLAYYSSIEHQGTLLKDFLHSLKNDGYKASEIVILSPRRNGIAQSLCQEMPWPLRPYPDGEPGAVHFTTVHSFKGLEAPCIILTDVDYRGSQECVSLFYIGVTRALHRLICLVSNSSKASVLEALQSFGRCS